MTNPFDHIKSLPIPDESVLNELLNKTKARLFFKNNSAFLGSLLCDHNYIWDDTVDTAWCNGSTIGWNPHFFHWLTDEERITVLAHELFHTGFDHLTRFGERHHETWNQAADFIINNHLQKSGFLFGDKLMSLEPCLDQSLPDMTTEQLYALLYKQNPPQQGNGQPSSSNGSGDPQAGKGWADIKQSTLTPTQQVTKMVKATQAAQVAKQAGAIPGEIATMIDKFLNPKLPWYVILSQHMSEINKEDFSWKRPNRKYDDEYLPSLYSEDRLTHISYYLDVSGSVTDEQIRFFNTEVKFIHENLQPEKLTLATFDTKIRDVYEFTEDMPFDKIEVHGRGGTDLNAVYRHIVDNKPSVAVVFTDHYCYPMTDPKIPVIWIIIGNPKLVVPYGMVIHVEDDL